MKKYIILFFINIYKVYTLSNNFFNHWTCIGIKDNIDFTKPYKINIGELPLVLWKDKNDNLITTLNICKHMGSKLDNADITSEGCLKCKYHGLEISYEDRFGDTIEHEGKIFWAKSPIHKKPYSTPFYNKDTYEKSYIEIDMECSLTDSAFNTMDLRHPEYVHNTIFGFGSNNPPQNIKQYKYKDRVGLAFEYKSNKLMQSLNDNILVTNNYHMYVYPTFTWSKVTFKEKDLIISVNFLPLENKKTRWYVTICHNYYRSSIEKEFMKLLATTILKQDFIQMKNQYEDNPLKKEVLFTHTFKDEEVILWLNDIFKKYKYPDMKSVLQLWRDDKNNKK